MAPTAPHRARAHRLNSSRRTGARLLRSRRAVSDVVATILILAITVTLFASIFAFVGSFPKPPAQNVNEFQASLKYTSSTHSAISGVSIEHLAGPALPSSDKVYLETSTSSSDWQFTISGGIPVYWGLTTNATSSTWSFGQNFTTTLHTAIATPDNITIYITSTTQLLYSAVIPGLVLTSPPAITSAGTTPSTVTPSETFVIWASLTGTLTGATVKVNLAGLPGLSGNYSMTKGSGGLYSRTVSGGVSTSGTWYAVIYANNTLGQITSTSVPVVVSGTSSGSSGITVTVGMSPSPPTEPTISSSSTAYFWATITYSGTLTAKACVNFTVSNVLAGKEKPTTLTTTILGTGTSCPSITGPSSVTIYGQTTYGLSAATSGSVVTVTASAKVTEGAGSGTGSLAFTVGNVFGGMAYFTTSSTGLFADKTTTVSHRCVTNHNCPYLYYELWNNYTTALGGPSSLTFTGDIYAYSGANNYTAAISSTINQGSNVLVDPAGTTTTFPLPGGNTGSVYTIVVLVTVSSAGTTVGYIYAHFQVTLT
jgi:FlaG/FlaF family flagellin (archaellin)